ncbi:MAG: GNAT family N-acetyltransferase [Leptolyngbya sp. SIO1D8]|nr:GNAT family N-acetyltransferase [Leptolyngbya sp. SIO1D8]
MNIRKITAQDLDGLCDLFVKVFKQEPWKEEWELAWAKERLQYILDSKYSESLIAENGHEIIGAILGRGMPFRGRLNFEIVEFFVSPHFRNQGIGTKLMISLEQILKQAKYHEIFLLTAKGSTAEIFYQKQHYRLNEQLCLMSKVLDEC